MDTLAHVWALVASLGALASITFLTVRVHRLKKRVRELEVSVTHRSAPPVKAPVAPSAEQATTGLRRRNVPAHAPAPAPVPEERPTGNAVLARSSNAPAAPAAVAVAAVADDTGHPSPEEDTGTNASRLDVTTISEVDTSMDEHISGFPGADISATVLDDSRDETLSQVSSVSARRHRFSDEVYPLLDSLLAVGTYETAAQGWEPGGTTRGIAIETKNGPHGVVVRGSGAVQASPARLAKILMRIDLKPYYVDSYAGGRVVEDLDEFTVITHFHLTANSPVTSKRDFLTIQHIKEFPDGTVVLPIRSVESTRCPPVKGYVRAHIHLCGWVLQPMGEGGVHAPATHVTYVADIDYKGKVPKMFVNKFVKDRPLGIDMLRYVVENDIDKRPVQPPPETPPRGR